ncbi:hypothetical protein PQX77_014995 [Marasmius sp. AFHP31]|nr:hypothetical protein PQX77_014995 [Marasmius sp. AFHP31]
MVVDLGGIVLQLPYLLHTSPQLYSIDQWNVIQRVHKNDRAFKVGLALEFETHVLAFTTKNLLFKPLWWTLMDNIKQLPDVVHDYPKFLEAMATWIKQEFMSGGDKDEVKLAFTAFWDCRVMHGAGVYTTSEVFQLAGISPLLLATEVFTNPSRIARLILAFYTFVARMYDQDFWQLIRPAIYGTVLAPTTSQCEKYTNFLTVYAQNKSQCTLREYKLVQEYKDKLTSLGTQPQTWKWEDSDIKLFDPFEPKHVECALDVSEANLGL